MPSNSIPFVLIFVILFFYLAVPTLLLSFLQLFLCRKELKWGRILPIVSAVVSVLFTLFILSFSVYSFVTSGGGLHGHASSIGGLGTPILAAVISLLVFNLPTLIYFLIYRSAKKKQAQNDLDRTRIDDLE